MHVGTPHVLTRTTAGALILAGALAGAGWVLVQAAPEYDFLIKGGHVIDPRSQISAVRDVAVKDGRIAAVASNIPASHALKAIDASGLYVTPGLVDIHVQCIPARRSATMPAAISASQGAFVSRDITGTIDGDMVSLASLVTERQGFSLSYRFSGHVEGDTMSGTLDMGEYLGARWTDRRHVYGRRA